MKTLEQVKEEILKLYDQDHHENNILNLPAADHKDPFLIEFEDEINHFINKDDFRITDLDEEEEIKEEIKKFEKSEGKKLSEEQKVLLRKVEERILLLLDELDISLYITVKRDLIKLLYRDSSEKYYDLIKSRDDEEKVLLKINEIVENKAFLYITDSSMRRKELLVKLLNRILPDINLFFTENSISKLQKMSLLQKKNLFKFYLKSIYDKYINPDRISGKLNRQDYEFLLNKVRTFFVHRYEKFLNEDQ